MSNTFLQIPSELTLKQLSSMVGSRNVNYVLNLNNLKRQKDISKQHSDMCDEIKRIQPEVSWKRKSEILNTFSTDTDVFEYAAMQDEGGWKVLDKTLSFEDTLSIPETIELVRYDDVLGNGQPVSKTVYDNVMNSLSETGRVSDTIFSEFSTMKVPKNRMSIGSSSAQGGSIFQMFNIPWGDITLYSSLSGDSKDIPVYPEEFTDARNANYDTMPDVLYQYEPWYTYNSSGPRSISLEFHMHRQMWTGDETDGKANELIRFCESNCYPKYNGSSVTTSIVTLYVVGKPLINGIITGCEVQWGGPIGRDGFYLEFTMTLAITEVSIQALNHGTVSALPLIG